MQLNDADEKMRARRWESFRRRVDYAPQNVYRHRTRGWEYVPVHPFGDEVANFERRGLRPDQCWGADAWWGIEGDATLLESAVASVARRPAGLYAKPTPHWERWVYLVAIFDAAFVTRKAFEDAMCRFADAGFPRATYVIARQSRSNRVPPDRDFITFTRASERTRPRISATRCPRPSSMNERLAYKAHGICGNCVPGWKHANSNPPLKLSRWSCGRSGALNCSRGGRTVLI